MPTEVRRRNSLRAGAYDYASVGSYFVTICVADRRPRFGRVVEGEMRLNEAGTMAAGVWRELPERFPFVEVDAYVVMPNHMHGIVVIHGSTYRDLKTPNRANTRFAPTSGDGRRAGGTGEGSLSRVIQGFKSVTTGLCINGVKEHGWEAYDGRLWQRSFYDHIIRDDRDLERIRAYIEVNPGRSSEDREYVPTS